MIAPNSNAIAKLSFVRGTAGELPAEAGSTVVATTVAVPLTTFGAKLATVLDSWAAIAAAIAIAFSRDDEATVMSTIGVFSGACAVMSSASLFGGGREVQLLDDWVQYDRSVASCANVRTCVAGR